jgi:hypothetical protein
VSGGEVVSLSVLTQEEREKPGAHTIAGSTDYPIPDAGHLKAAIARYKQGALAGHPAGTVKKHIMARARALGMQLQLTEEGELLELASRPATRGPYYPAPSPMTAMDHGEFDGTHSHPHMVREVHEHEHHHNHDSRHECGVYPRSVY